ncbi:MAG: putative penicillin-binding protein PbpX [Stenotrophomonas maltophilia]|uniref:Putative penicillin-binding protein PbpX n=1 Tax=Stenotrophomonas maltophilia TaxID=40324 RepID=A0A7V8FJU3_STEMA|nr:MAG: putative penicillin-binding protein PbpX [Stenotrophomonas maltophilia]
MTSAARASRRWRRITHGLLLASAFVLAPAQAQAPLPASTPAPPAGTDSPTPDAPPAASGALDAARINTFLDGLVPYLMDQGDLAGAVVTVVENGRVVTERGFGYADIEKRTPVDPRTTLFRPGSISKLFTWTAVMQLVEQGKLDLDADINTYLDIKVPAHGQPITLRQIMTHTSGLEERMRYLIVLGPDHPAQRDDYLKDWVPGQIFAPGTRPAYSNYATGIASYIVDRVSGQRFEDYARQHILQPLGMQYASFEQKLPAELLPHVAKGYRLGSGKNYPAKKNTVPGIGGLYASGASMSRFMMATLNHGELDGQHILRADTTAQMLTPQQAILPHLPRMTLGWMASDTAGYDTRSHGGTMLFFYSWLWLIPERNIGVFISTNSVGRDAAGSALRAQVWERFVDEFLPPQPLTRADPGVNTATAQAHAKALAGVNWQSTRRSDSSYLRLTSLFSPVRVHPQADGSITVDGLKGLNGQLLRWREVSPWLWQQEHGRGLLEVKLEGGRPVYFSGVPFASVFGFEPMPGWRSPSWLRPAAIIALAVLVLSAVLRVSGVFVRRYYGATAPAEGRRLRVLQTLSVSVLLASVVAWALYLQTIAAPGGIADYRNAPLLAVQALSWLGVLAAAALAWVALRAPASWPRLRRVGSVVVALAGLVLAFVLITQRLLSTGVQL